MVFPIGEIRPPTSGFKEFIIYREPGEDVDIWIILPEKDETYRVNIDYLRRWMMPMYDNDWQFIDSSLDHLWNFYHCKFVPGELRVTTLPLSDAYSYNLGGDGLDVVTKLVNRVKATLLWR